MGRATNSVTSSLALAFAITWTTCATAAAAIPETPVQDYVRLPPPSQRAEPPKPAPPRFQISPLVLRSPVSADVTRFFPPEARRQGVGGRATVICTTSASTKLEKCRVLSETPKGYGFGAAALQIVDRFRVAPGQVNDEIVPTDFTVPITFLGPPSQPARTAPQPPREAPREAPQLRRTQPAADRPAIAPAQPKLAPQSESSPAPNPTPRPKKPRTRLNGVLWAPSLFAVVVIASLAIAALPPRSRRGRSKRQVGQFA